jgi:hypothetical protein
MRLARAMVVLAATWALQGCGSGSPGGPLADVQAELSQEAAEPAQEAEAETAPEAALETTPDSHAEAPAQDTTELAAPPTPAELAALVTPADHSADLALIALPREPGSAHWQEVQELCAARFASLGYVVERQSYGSGGVPGLRDASGGQPRNHSGCLRF